MINALHSSRDNGTKSFQQHGVTFGWKDIMWVRESDKRKAGHARMVPKLRESHIVQDSWTKLNVAPDYKMWVRESDKRKAGHARMVPKLRESHIVQDSWTKLNVAPAKIMQVQTCA